MKNTRIYSILQPLMLDNTITVPEAIAIYRCLLFSEQIADQSIGNMFRPDIANLLSTTRPPTEPALDLRGYGPGLDGQ